MVLHVRGAACRIISHFVNPLPTISIRISSLETDSVPPSTSRLPVCQNESVSGRSIRADLQNSQHLLYIYILFAPFLVAKHPALKKSSPRKSSPKASKSKKTTAKSKVVEEPPKKSG